MDKWFPADSDRIDDDSVHQLWRNGEDVKFVSRIRKVKVRIATGYLDGEPRAIVVWSHNKRHTIGPVLRPCRDCPTKRGAIYDDCSTIATRQCHSGKLVFA